MGFEKTILKGETAGQLVFEYTPKEFSMDVSSAAVDYVHVEENRRKSDFKISEHAAHQSVFAKLEGDREQGIMNEQVL